ncbi:hypothetical protein [Paenibacillus eucommiae]|uniref:Cell division ATPase FtsA n=1 Tax=Paenibacillus eucommiae TaxID=1355755 RepID=A0ABS4IPL8_9BACL|nr:hypothetical protein [Paenibacillus eucommiae]MBP1989511.1 cell division ATPase FtsA [Paenibacillus eucommiae]
MKRIQTKLFLLLVLLVLLIGCVGCEMASEKGDKEHNTEVTKTDTKVDSTVKLSDKEVKDILNQLIPKALNIHVGLFNTSNEFKVDETKTIPGDVGYVLVLDEKVKTVADLKKTVEEVFTKDIAQKVFYSRYLTPEKGDRPRYKDYDGKLYVDIETGGRGWATTFLIDSAKLKGQKGRVAEIELNRTVLDDPADPLTIKIEYVNGKWLLASRLD